MLIVFGTTFNGRIASHEGQRIETQFFSVMFVPIFPLKSMFVTEAGFRKRNGFEMDLQTKSVLATYARTVTTGLAAFFIWNSFIEPYFSSADLFFNKIMALVFTGLAVYFWVFFGKASAGQKAMRNKVASITGIYAEPHWIEFYRQMELLKAFEIQYNQLYPGMDWKDVLTNGNPPAEQHKLLYGLALFNCMINDTPANDELYARADSLYV
jgi:hypothetical protein